MCVCVGDIGGGVGRVIIIPAQSQSLMPAIMIEVDSCFPAFLCGVRSNYIYMAKSVSIRFFFVSGGGLA